MDGRKQIEKKPFDTKEFIWFYYGQADINQPPRKGVMKYKYIVTVNHGGKVFDIIIRAKSPSQAMANTVTQYPGAKIVRVS